MSIGMLAVICTTLLMSGPIIHTSVRQTKKQRTKNLADELHIAIFTPRQPLFLHCRFTTKDLMHAWSHFGANIG